MVVLGEASDDGVPVVGGGGGDAAEDSGGVGEASGGGGGGAEVEELGARGVESEESGDNEVGLKLFDVRERSAFL